MPAEPLKPAVDPEPPLTIYSVFQLPDFDANADQAVIAVPHFEVDETPDAIAAPEPDATPVVEPLPSGDVPATDNKEN